MDRPHRPQPPHIQTTNIIKYDNNNVSEMQNINGNNDGVDGFHVNGRRSLSRSPTRSPGRHVFQGGSARNSPPRQMNMNSSNVPSFRLNSTTNSSTSTSHPHYPHNQQSYHPFLNSMNQKSGGTTPREQTLEQQDEQKERKLPSYQLLDRADAMRVAGGIDDEDSSTPYQVTPWRMRERMKTVQVAIVMCLNIGTDPPDVVKTPPYARDECWIDPLSLPPQKAIERIGQALQSQYERWQARAR
jgi:hypothetical protein